MQTKTCPVKSVTVCRDVPGRPRKPQGVDIASSAKLQAPRPALMMPQLKDINNLERNIMKTYKYDNKKVTKKSWLERLKKYPGWQRKLEIIKKTGKYRIWQIC